MIGQGIGSRRYNDTIMLTYSRPTAGTLGHPVMGVTSDVMEVFASVQRMSATKTMMTFEQADAVGLEIEFRNPGDVVYNGIRWNGHNIYFSEPERLDNRGRIVRVQGWYQVDNPKIA